MTLHALRKEVGDQKFFQILQDVGRRAGRRHGDDPRVHRPRRADLSRRTSTRLFANWLSAGYPVIDTGPGNGNGNNLSVRNLGPAARSFVERLADRPGQPFRDAKGPGK